MKLSSILIFAFIVVATTLSAQNPRIETLGNKQIHTYNFTKGGDSIRFAIVGKNDTVQVTVFHRNGNKAVTFWKRDSAVMFDVLGRLTSASYGLKNNFDSPDSTVRFFSNGRIQTVNAYKNGRGIIKSFNKEGRLVGVNLFQNTPSVFFQKTLNGDGKVVQSTKRDTVYEQNLAVFYQYDTSFYENGRPYRITKFVSYPSSRNLGYKQTQYIYKEDGQLLTISYLPDSSVLIVFKDNVDCFYGLKNEKGDTVVKPRFDRINSLDDLFFVAYIGESAFLLDKKGAPMSPPVDRLRNVFSVPTNSETGDFEDINYDNEVRWPDTYEENRVRYYAFETQGQYGVMTDKMVVVMPPQYFRITRSFDKGSFFLANQTHKDSAYKNIVLNREGKLVFPKSLTNVSFSGFQDFFILNPYANYFNSSPHQKIKDGTALDAVEEKEVRELSTYALGQASTGLVLPQKFNNISRIRKTSIFKTQQYRKDAATGLYHEINGLFNARTKRWLLDTSKFRVDNNLDNNLDKNNAFFVIQNVETKKMGLMDTLGNYILLIAYDTVGIADADKGLFWIKKDRKYQIVSIEKGKIKQHTTKYDFLVGVAFHAYEFGANDKHVYFVAKQKDKWGVVDAADKIIKPFEFDYGYVETENTAYLILVKDGQAAKYDLKSLPYETNWQTEYSINDEFLQKNKAYKLIDNSNRVFFANETGKVIIPPQYKLIRDDLFTGFGFLEDDKKNQKIVFFQTGQIVDYPFHYTLTAADAKSRVMIVSDTSHNSIGVVSTDGKLLIPCVNYAAVYGDAAQSVFFVKRDTPIIKGALYNLLFNTFGGTRDSLDAEDVDWQMFDGNGKMLTDKPFRFAIRFRQGVGIGMQEAGFNLYKNNGTILTPFFKNTEGGKKTTDKTLANVASYTNIRHDTRQRTYTLFYNQGLTPRMLVTKADGEILVESGRYDGISRFYGKYALVTAAAKVGLIDTFGREIIAPQDLRIYKGHFMDSLNLVNAKHDAMVKADGYTSIKQVIQPLFFGQKYENVPHPDSLAITTTQRTTLWNLLLEKTFDRTIMTASDIRIEHLLSNVNNMNFDNYFDYQKGISYRPVKYIVEDSSFAFVLNQRSNSSGLEFAFHNFYRKNNRWEELKINDLLQVQGEKRWLLNDLITKKVKALKDQEIDCSNTSAFITTVENRFMLTKTGVDFCFDSTKEKRDFVVVAFTWAELLPFLKIKVY